MGVMRPELVMKSIVPVVMAGVLGIYGLIIAVIISTGSKSLCCRNYFQGLGQNKTPAKGLSYVRINAIETITAAYVSAKSLHLQGGCTRENLR